MEPVTVTRGVRRTVRVAVALVIGQALLGVLIGWVTLPATRPGPGGGVPTRQPTVIDDRCAPAGAYRLPERSTPVRCERVGRQRPRWKID